MLQPGDRVGPYTIAGHLGSGGMGEVYRAHDPRLNRSLALKVLPADVDRDSVRRFTAEAQAASALNHPHILSIFEAGQADDVHYIAMELVEGETLRAHVTRRTPLPKLLSPLAQVADGLARAHASGLIHRDLKPENVMVTHDGYAKILDFGLAKLIDPERIARPPHHPDAITTETGAVLGTVGYMSPEQVLRAPLDARSDLFAFGCILYELATGRQPFVGDSAIDTLHKIVYDSPDPLPASVDPAYAQLVMRCLAKKPDRRIGSAREVAEALRAMERGSGSAPSIHITDLLPATVSRRRWRSAWIAVAAVALLAAVVAGVLWLRPDPPPPAVVAAAPVMTKLTNHGRVRVAEIAPDGRYIAQVVEEGDRDLLVLRHTATQSETTIASEELSTVPAISFSADSDHVYYVVTPRGDDTGTLYRIPLLGGAKEPLFDEVSSRPKIAGSRIAFVRYRGDKSFIVAGNLDDRSTRSLLELNTPAYIADVAWSGNDLAFIQGDRRAGRHDVVVMSTAARELWRAPLQWFYIARLASLPGGDFAVSGKPAEDGRLGIWRVHRANGRVTKLTGETRWYNHISATADGKRLVTVERGRSMNLHIADGAQTRQVTRGSGDYFGVDWAAPGLAIYASDSSGAFDLWQLDLESGRTTPLTRDQAVDFFPAVSPDLSRIAFVSSRGGQRNVWELDRATRALRRLTSGLGEQWPRYSPDGAQVIYTSYGKGFWEARIVDRATGSDRELTSRRAITGEFSPDGRSIAVIAENPMRIELVDRRGRVTKTVAVPAGFSMTGNVRWRRDGRALLYVATENGTANVWEHALDGGTRRRVTDFTTGNIEQFDTEPGGDRLIVIHGVIFNDAVQLSLE